MSLARLDARAKLALAAGLLLASLAGDLVVAALALAAALGLLLASGLAHRTRSLALAALGLAPFVLLNGLLVGGEPALAWGPVALSRVGLWAGAGFAVRALAGLALGLWLLGTTSARDALSLLHRWPRLAVLAAGTLRFAPLVARDWQRVREAQALRGHAPAEGLRAAARSAPLMVPLFVLTVQRGQAVDEALQASAFGSGPRTPPERRPLRASHALVAFAGIALAALVLARAGGLL